MFGNYILLLTEGFPNDVICVVDDEERPFVVIVQGVLRVQDVFVEELLSQIGFFLEALHVLLLVGLFIAQKEVLVENWIDEVQGKRFREVQVNQHIFDLLKDADQVGLVGKDGEVRQFERHRLPPNVYLELRVHLVSSHCHLEIGRLLVLT